MTIHFNAVKIRQLRALVCCVFGIISVMCVHLYASPVVCTSDVEVSFSVFGEIEKKVIVDAEGKVSNYTPSKSCSGKVFVGWSDDLTSQFVDLSTATFSISATLYAVFACQNGGNTIEKEIQWSEDFELYSAKTDYNSIKSRLLINANSNLYSSVYCGNVSTTNAIQGRSILLQANTQYSVEEASSFTIGPIHDLTSFSWQAKNQNGSPMYVYYSIDNSNWKPAKWNETTTISTNAQDYNLLEIPNEKELYIRIFTTQSNTTSKPSRLFLDNFCINAKVNTYFYTNYSTKQETLKEAKMVFDVNGGDVDISAEIGSNQWITLPAPKRGNVRFLGWKVTSVDGYTEMFSAGSKYLLNSNVTLQAQWETQVSGNPLDIVDWSAAGITVNMNGKAVSKGIQCNGIALAQGNYSGDNVQGDRTFFIPLSAISTTALEPGKDISLHARWNYQDGEQYHSESNGYYRVPYMYESTDDVVETSLSESDDIVVRSGRAVIKQDMSVRNVYVYPDAELVVEAQATLKCKAMYLRTRPFASPILTNNGTLDVGQMYYTRICADKSAYYHLALPFSSRLEDMRLSTGEALEYGVKWLVKRYDVERRAEQGTANGSNWVALSAGDKLEAGTGYTMLSGSMWYREYCFPVEYVKPSEQQTIGVMAYTGVAADENAAHGGWNFVCLPLTTVYTSDNNASPESAVKISELREDNCTYWQHVVEKIVPAKPFYYQAAADGKLVLGESMSFEEETASASIARKSYNDTGSDNVPTQWVRLILSNTIGKTDETSVYLHPVRFERHYMPQYDLVKMKGYGQRPILYSIIDEEERSFSALPDTLGEHGIRLGYYAPVSGWMTIALYKNTYLRRLRCVYLYDRVADTTIDLLKQDYTFESQAGEDTTRFVLQCEFAPSVSTSLTGDCEDAYIPEKVWQNGRLYIRRGDRLYDVLGR